MLRAGKETAGRCRLWIVAWIVLVSGGGCTTFSEYVHNGFKVGPNYQRPAAPVATDWIDSDDQRIRKQEDDLSHWWSVLDDPALDALVADAYRQNLTLRDAGFRILQARALLGVSIGNFFPQTQYAYGDALRDAYSQKAANRSYLTQRFFNQWDLGFGLAWELDFWGRFRRAIEAADADLNASVEYYDDVLVTLLGDVATAYVNIRIYEQQIMLTRANVELQRETLKLVKARFEGGQVSELDVDQAQSLLSQTEAQIPVLEISLRTANNQLCVLMGRPMVNLEPQIGPENIPTAPTDVIVGIPADLLRRRPDVRVAERMAAGQAARIGVAVSDWYPHISIVGTLDYQAQDFQHLFSGRAIQGDVGPSFQWNILNYGRILNNVRATDALFQQLVVDYQQTVLVAQQEAENGLITFVKSQEQAKDLMESVVAAQNAVIIALAQYKAGMIDFNRVALLEQNLVTYQNQQAQARGNIALGLVQTYRALGGGWSMRLDPAMENAPGLGARAARPAGGPEAVPAPAPVPLLDPNLETRPIEPEKSTLRSEPIQPGETRDKPVGWWSTVTAPIAERIGAAAIGPAFQSGLQPQAAPEQLPIPGGTSLLEPVPMPAAGIPTRARPTAVAPASIITPIAPPPAVANPPAPKPLPRLPEASQTVPAGSVPPPPNTSGRMKTHSSRGWA